MANKQLLKRLQDNEYRIENVMSKTYDIRFQMEYILQCYRSNVQTLLDEIEKLEAQIKDDKFQISFFILGDELVV